MGWLLSFLLGGVALFSSTKAQSGIFSQKQTPKQYGPFLPVGPQSKASIDAAAWRRLRNHMISVEGYRNDVYRDTEGILTVGIGHKVLPTDNLRLGQVISDQQVENFYKKDSTLAFNAAKKQAAELRLYNPDFIVALTSVNFQLGTYWHKDFYNTYNLLRTGQYSRAIANLKSSKWARQTPVRVNAFIDAIRRNAVTVGA